jgi:hypothetical protein
VADTVVAPDAIEFFVIDCTMGGDLADEIAMAIQAIGIQNAGAFRTNPNGLIEILECESLGMVIAVGDFYQPFPEESVRNVTVVANGKAVMAGFLPPVELFAHDVAVHAHVRVV